MQFTPLSVLSVGQKRSASLANEFVPLVGVNGVPPNKVHKSDAVMEDQVVRATVVAEPT